MDAEDPASPLVADLQRWGELNSDKDWLTALRRSITLNRLYIAGMVHCTPNRIQPLKEKSKPAVQQFDEMNRLGFLTVSSQPGAIVKAKSDANKIQKKSRAFVEGFLLKPIAEFLADDLNSQELIAYVAPIPDDPMKHVFFLPVSYELDTETDELESTNTIGVGETFEETFGKIMPDSPILPAIESRLVFFQIVDPTFGRAAHDKDQGLNSKILQSLAKYWKKTSNTPIEGFVPL